jgi:hypothetical protein
MRETLDPATGLGLKAQRDFYTIKMVNRIAATGLILSLGIESRRHIS